MPGTAAFLAYAGRLQVRFILSEIHEREGRLKESLEAATKALTILHKFGGHADNIAIVRERIAPSPSGVAMNEPAPGQCAFLEPT